MCSGYTVKVHDAGQTGHDPDSKDYVRAELPDGQDTLLRSVLVSGAVLMIDLYTELYFGIL